MIIWRGGKLQLQFSRLLNFISNTVRVALSVQKKVAGIIPYREFQESCAVTVPGYFRSQTQILVALWSAIL